MVGNNAPCSEGEGRHELLAMAVKKREESATTLILGKKSTSGSLGMSLNALQKKQFRPGRIVVEEESQRASDRDNDSFASADDIGVLNEAFDDAIDNLTRFGDLIEEIFTFLTILNS